MLYELSSALSTLRIGALLNTSSGSCDVTAQQELESLAESAGLQLAKIWCGDGDAVEKALAEVGQHHLDVLIVLGGDGTIRAAAETCTESGPYLVPLPGGTMNMLPKGLYGELSWQEALQATLARPKVQHVNGGRVAERQFFVAAIIGAPSRWAEAREAVREGEIGKAIEEGLDALKTAFRQSLHYRFDGQEGDAEAVSILCPLTSRALEDDEMILEAAVLTPESAMEALRLAAKALFAEWRADPSVMTAKVRNVVCTSEKPIPAILDGEMVELGRSASVDFIPAAFKALVPGEGETTGLVN